jgi:hypothetical protein
MTDREICLSKNAKQICSTVNKYLELGSICPLKQGFTDVSGTVSDLPKSVRGRTRQSVSSTRSGTNRLDTGSQVWEVSRVTRGCPRGVRGVSGRVAAQNGGPMTAFRGLEVSTRSVRAGRAGRNGTVATPLVLHPRPRVCCLVSRAGVVRGASQHSAV